MNSFIAQESFSDFPLWEKISNKRIPLDFFLEITARCNNNCRHCYINLPAQDREAQRRELSLSEISDIADQAVVIVQLATLILKASQVVAASASIKKAAQVVVSESRCKANQVVVLEDILNVVSPAS